MCLSVGSKGVYIQDSSYGLASVFSQYSGFRVTRIVTWLLASPRVNVPRGEAVEATTPITDQTQKQTAFTPHPSVLIKQLYGMSVVSKTTPMFKDLLEGLTELSLQQYRAHKLFFQQCMYCFSPVQPIKNSTLKDFIGDWSYRSPEPGAYRNSKLLETNQIFSISNIFCTDGFKQSDPPLTFTKTLI